MGIRRFSALLIGGLAASILVACGGGGGGGGEIAATSAVSVTVIDGAIENALVCLDKNTNGACDVGEPQGRTTADGKVTFTVAKADLGQYPILAVVGTDAIDKDTGAVTERYVMKAPKDAAALVTPLTTLVQTTVETTGGSTKDAASAVQLQLGITNSPLDDFTKNSDTTAQAIANAVVVTTQQQSALVKAAVGTKTSSDATITQADVDKLVTQKVAALAQQLATAASDATVTAAGTAVARVAALKVKTAVIVSTDGIKDKDSASVAVDQAKTTLPDTSFVGGEARASLANFRFNSLSDNYMRYSVRTAAEATPVNGVYKYRWLRQQRYGNGDVANWTEGSHPSRGTDLHWTGSAWSACEINGQHTQTVPDAKGNGSYNYCNGLELGTSNNTAADISSKKMIDIYQAIRSQGYDNIKIGLTADAAATLLGTAAFPDKSTVNYNNSINTVNAVGYYPGDGNWVNLPDADLAAGKATACSNSPEAAKTATLDQLVAIMRGTPCVNKAFNGVGLNSAKIESGDRNESWTNTTLSLGVIGTAPTYSDIGQASSYYTGNTRVRVAFADGNVAKYYVCKESWSGSARNCDAKGTGTYKIETVGANKVMGFTGLPSILASSQSWERKFVQSGTHVFYGYQDLPAPGRTVRLNQVAANALFAQLGMSKVIAPSDRVNLTAASYDGYYKGTFTGSVTGSAGGTAIDGTFYVSVTPGSTTQCGGTSSGLVTVGNPTGQFACSVSSVTPPTNEGSTATFTAIVDGDNTFTGSVDYYTGALSGTWKSGDNSVTGTFAATRQ